MRDITISECIATSVSPSSENRGGGGEREAGGGGNEENALAREPRHALSSVSIVLVADEEKTTDA
jgi:hypothetical protein